MANIPFFLFSSVIVPLGLECRCIAHMSSYSRTVWMLSPCVRFTCMYVPLGLGWWWVANPGGFIACATSPPATIGSSLWDLNAGASRTCFLILKLFACYPVVCASPVWPSRWDLVGGGLLIRGFHRLRDVTPGYHKIVPLGLECRCIAIGFGTYTT